MDYRSSSGVPATRCFSTGVSGFGSEQALEASPRSALTAALSRSNSASVCSAQEPDAGRSRHAVGQPVCGQPAVPLPFRLKSARRTGERWSRAIAPRVAESCNAQESVYALPSCKLAVT